MYQKYYGLDSKPFSIAPDPRFLYLSERHREALAHLLYGLGEGGGFVQLTGEVGTGKTTLCRAVLDQVPDHVDVAVILNPRVNELELIATVCDELKVPYPTDTRSIKSFTDVLNRHLLESHAAGRKTVLLIDEAQNLSQAVLEQVRLLTNLETADEKLLQIILIGQPELKTLLARNDLRQLAQRITARYHLEPLTRDETRAYIQHRLRVCGGAIDLFTPGAMEEVQRLSGGVPRLINILCDRALLGGYVEERRRIDRRIVRRAASEVMPDLRDRSQPRSHASWAAALGGLAVLITAVAWVGYRYLPETADLTALAWFTPQTQAHPGPASRPAESSREESTASAAVDNAVDRAAEAEARDSLSDKEAQLTQYLAEADGGGDAAWNVLFRRWGVNEAMNEHASACDQAQALGLKCLHRTGNWNQLRQMNRPAVLQLLAQDGRRIPVPLERIEQDQAVLRLGEQQVRLPLAAVERVWMGEYSVLWRSPIQAELLRPGDVSADVLWLRTVLAHDGVLQLVEGDEVYQFDQELQQAVEAFQAERGLRQDGVVGTLTLIQLNNADRDNQSPRLMASAQG